MCGASLGKTYPIKNTSLSQKQSCEICKTICPLARRALFFGFVQNRRGGSRKRELRTAYDRIHEFYDEFWLKEAAAHP